MRGEIQSAFIGGYRRPGWLRLAALCPLRLCGDWVWLRLYCCAGQALGARSLAHRGGSPAGATAGIAGCAGHVQQLGSGSLLPNLMEVKG